MFEFKYPAKGGKCFLDTTKKCTNTRCRESPRGTPWKQFTSLQSSLSIISFKEEERCG